MSLLDMMRDTSMSIYTAAVLHDIIERAPLSAMRVQQDHSHYSYINFSSHDSVVIQRCTSIHSLCVHVAYEIFRQ